MRKGINKELRTGMVPGRVWGAEALGMVRSQKELLRKQLQTVEGKEVSSLSLTLLGDRQSGDRARAGVCSNTLLGTSNVGRAMG